MGKMKAIVYSEYGEPAVLKIQEVEKPYPKENEVLIRVYAVSVNFGDLMARNFKNISTKEFNMPILFYILTRIGFGFSKPKTKVLRNAFAGKIEAVGTDIKQFREGDSVVGYTGMKMGAYAAYVCMRGNGMLAAKPSNMTYEEALLFIQKLVEDGKIKSVVDKIFPLEQAAEAHKYVESRMKKGDMVITV